jgi:hypothetical protein
MTQPNQTYNANAKCLKCGNDEVTTNYHEGCSKATCTTCHAYHCKGGGKEHLLRHCTRCHYEWTEGVLVNA